MIQLSTGTPDAEDTADTGGNSGAQAESPPIDDNVQEALSVIADEELAWDTPELTELETTIQQLQHELPDSLPFTSPLTEDE